MQIVSLNVNYFLLLAAQFPSDIISRAENRNVWPSHSLFFLLSARLTRYQTNQTAVTKRLLRLIARVFFSRKHRLWRMTCVTKLLLDGYASRKRKREKEPKWVSFPAIKHNTESSCSSTDGQWDSEWKCDSYLCFLRVYSLCPSCASDMLISARVYMYLALRCRHCSKNLRGYDDW